MPQKNVYLPDSQYNELATLVASGEYENIDHAVQAAIEQFDGGCTEEGHQ